MMVAKSAFRLVLVHIAYGMMCVPLNLVAQRDSLYGLDSTILAWYDTGQPQLWPNGTIRSHFVESDSVFAKEGFWEDGTLWFDALYRTVYDEEGTLRGGVLLQYREYFKGTKVLRIAGKILKEGDVPDFTPVEEWRVYFPSGSLRSIAQYDPLNELSGKYQEYHENGKLALNGRYCVRWVAVDPPCEELLVGEMRSIISGNRSMPCGIWERYDHCGELRETVTYEWKD